MTDSDCLNGYCDQSGTGTGAGGGAADRIAPPGICVYPNCNDNSEAICAMAQPICDPGFVAAIQNGCWACLDARTCSAQR